MAKKLILGILVRVLGEFIELDENNFSLAVWSGTVVLTNLRLRGDNILQKFNFEIYHGYVERLEIIIPWASLLSSPLKIKLEGLYLDFGPVDLDGLAKEQILRMMIQEKLQKLKMIDQFLEISSSVVLSSEAASKDAGANTSTSYLQQWGSKIIDNIEMSFSRIHLRYEDSSSIAGKQVAAGITLDSFFVSTCDERWQPGFQSSAQPSNGTIHKLASIDGLGVYWDISSKPIAGLPFDEWKVAMNKMIHTSTHQDTGIQCYLLSPHGSGLSMRIAHYKQAGSGDIRFAAWLESKDLRIHFDNQQFRQMQTIRSNLAALREIRDPNNYRPLVRPTDSKLAPFLWWQYAKKLVTLRPKYIRILRLYKKAAADKVMPAAIIPLSDLQAFQDMEERLPLKVLEAFRRRAMAQFVEEKTAEKKEVQNHDAKAGQWWGWLGSSTPTAERLSGSGSDISLDDITSEFERLESSNARQAFQAFSLSLSTSCTLTLSSHMRNIIKTKAALDFSFEKKFETLHARCDLHDLLVTDELGICPFHEKIISLKALESSSFPRGGDDTTATTTAAAAATSSAAVKDNLSGTTIIIDVVGDKTKMQIFSLPLEIYVNKVILHALLMEFSTPKQHKARRIKRKVHQMRLESHLGGQQESAEDSNTMSAAKSLTDAIISGQSSISVVVQVHGPKIIIPEDSAKDIGCLVLDCGFIDVQFAAAATGMNCNVKLQAINVGLPLTISDVYFLKGKSLYLIKPFDLQLQAQNVDQTDGDMTVELMLSPGIQGELDIRKLGSLLRIAYGMTDIVSPKSSPFGDSGNNNNSNLSAYESSAQVSRQVSSSDLTSEPMSPAPGYRTPPPKQAQTTGVYTSMFQKLTPFPMMKSPSTDERDLNNIDMRIVVRILSVSLDLDYVCDPTSTVKKSEHILFSLEGLELIIVNRPTDRQIDFTLTDFIVQDTWRVEDQRYVAWTPKTSDTVSKLITVSYLTIAHPSSPLYTTHGSILQANFAELHLSVDTATLNHLKPFFETLLDKSNRAASVQTIAEVEAPVQDAQNEDDVVADSNASSKYRLVSILQVNNDSPPGMKVEASLARICINLLRAPVKMVAQTVPLDSAFTASMSNMRVVVDMMDLMSSTLRIHRVEIFDKRETSRDYVYRHLFQPSVNSNNNNNNSASAAGCSAANAIDSPVSGADDDLIVLQYMQESRSQTLINVNIAGISSYIAVDAMLDFALLGTANFFAFTGLLSSPAPKVDASSSSSSVVVQPTPSLMQDDQPLQTTYYTMNATVKMVDCKLIFLEDPAVTGSRAIVGQAAAEVHFSREVRTTGANVQMFESLHVSVADNEMYVVRSIAQWSPIPIIEPFGVELHVKRSTVNGQTTLSSMQLDIDDIDAKLSFNDLLLGASIINRRTLAHSAQNDATDDQQNNSPPKTTSSSASSSSPSSDAEYDQSLIVSSVEDDQQQKQQQQEKKTAITVQVNFSAMTVTVVNDFSQLPIPVLRLSATGMCFAVDGQSGDMRGDGSAHLKMDYFNSPLLVWEPVLDSWKPGLRIISEGKSNVMEIVSDNTLQLTVSGSMLETMLRSYSIFFHERKELQLQQQQQQQQEAAISVQNILGVGISLTLLDSASKAALLALDHSEVGVIASFADPSKRSWMKLFRVPNCVDLHLQGQEFEKRLPVMHLPFTVNKPRACILLPDQASRATDNNSNSNKPSQTFIVEAIEEEVFENARYDPITGLWKPPFLLGDPYRYTDASGLVRKDKAAIEIHSEKWEWSGPWEVDMDGIVGRDFDEDGWEYANSFSFFSMVSSRRAYQAMDGVKRRRWTRTRVPKVMKKEQQRSDSSNTVSRTSSSSNSILRPFTIFWDVQTRKDGSRFVQVRSSFQIVNNLPCTVYVELQHSSWPEDVCLGPIREGETVCVPLLQSYASQLRFRIESPSNPPGPYYPCNVHSYDFRTAKDAVCMKQHQTTSASVSAASTISSTAVHFRMWTIREDKSVTVKLEPYVQVTNKLLCELQFSCADKKMQVVEQGMLMSGAVYKMTNVDLKDDIRVSFRFGAYHWSYPLQLRKLSSSEGVIEMHRSEQHRDILPVSYASRIRDDYCIELDIFFKVAMIDRSGLRLFVRSSYAKQMHLVRGFRNSISTEAAAASSAVQSRSSSPVPPHQHHHHHHHHHHNSHHNHSSPPSNKNSSFSSLSMTQRSMSPTMASLTLPAIDRVDIISPHNPLLVKMDVGSAVYSDCNFRWTHLPPTFRNKYSIRFANADKTIRSSQYFAFTVGVEMLVFVLMDASQVPAWVNEEGYQPTTSVAVARRVNKGRMTECNYRVYGKLVQEQGRVQCGGAWGSQAPNMFAMVLIPRAQWDAEESERLSSSDYVESHNISNNSSNNSNSGNDITLSMFDQITHADQFCMELAALHWTEGCNGVTAFYSKDNTIQIRGRQEDSWSEDINIDTRKNAATKGSVEIYSERSGIVYHVSYTLQNLPGLYRQTQLITFMPRFCVLNCLEESVFMAQRGSHRHLEFQPYVPEGWHQIDDKAGFDVKIRCQSTIWSLGSVNINEIGTSVLYIPFVGADPNNAYMSSSSSSAGAQSSRGMVLHVEVKLASHTDHCSVVIVVWQETIESQAAMSVQNDSELPICIRQAGIELNHDLGRQERLYEFVIPPKTQLPFGLCDPDCGSQILVTVGTNMPTSSKRVATVNLLHVGHRLRLPFAMSGGGRGEVILNITTNDVGHVLKISSTSTSLLGMSASRNSLLDGDDELTVESDTLLRPQNSASIFGFNLLMSSLGISLVLEKPNRREFFSLYVDGIAFKLRSAGTVKTMELSVVDLQVDNYSESAIYPIILRSTKKEIHTSVQLDGDDDMNSASYDPDEPRLTKQRHVKPDNINNSNNNNNNGNEQSGESGNSGEEGATEDEKPLIKLLIVRDLIRETQQPVFHRVTLRILPVAVELDSATVQILFLDLLDRLKVLTSDQALAVSSPETWHRDFNHRIFYPGVPLIDVVDVKVATQKNKLYIKKLTIHPMKVTISLYQTALPRRTKKDTLQSALLNFLLQLIGVEKLQIRLTSFVAEDVMETSDTLVSLIMAKSMQDIQAQLASIAGSLAVFGSPIGFARKVGSGVKAFFYEPYLGVVEGSQDFLSGLKKGTSRLISGVLTGTMDSAVAMIGSASKSMTYLTGDEDYVRKRAIRRQQMRQGQKGIYAGFRDGGESLVSGIAAGVSGLFSKPIEEASKSGVKGFIKGLGLGVLGMAVKPLVGFTDGITSIAHGISTEVDPNNIFVHVRPPRALEPSPLDPSVWVLVPLNLEAAYAQEFVVKRAQQNKYDDRFLSYIPLGHKDEAIILSDVYIFWRRPKSLWGRVWANISHVLPLGDALGVMLYSGAMQGHAELVIIPCGSERVLRVVYSAVVQHVHRMGNPSKVTPVDIVDWAAQHATVQDYHTRRHTQQLQQQQHPEKERKEGGLAHQDLYKRFLRESSPLGELDGYRFGSVNGKMLRQVTGSEMDVALQTQAAVQRGSRSWKELDELMWTFLWDWGCVHANLASCRCCVTLIINRSESPLQVARVQMHMGRNVLILGSAATGYETESRILWPRGYVVVLMMAFPHSPLEVGHLKTTVHSAAFTLVVASTQRESFCEAKGGYTTGFLEKTVSEWWSKYVVLVT